MSRTAESSKHWTGLLALLFVAASPAAGRQSGGAHCGASIDDEQFASDSAMRPALRTPCAALRGPQLGADGRWIVHAAELASDGTWELRSVPATGGAPRRIAGPFAPGEHAWALAPDGTRVVYLDRDLFSVPVDGRSRDGSSAVRLGDQHVTGDVLDFAFSPDGSRLVYRAGPRTSLGLFSVASDGSGAPREIAGGERLASGDPYAISPDGRSVVFLARGEGGAELRSVGARGGRIARLSRAGSSIPDFRIDAHGEHVVHRSEDRARGTFDLHTVPLDGRLAPVKLNTSGDVQDYRVSPDGAWVVYLVDSGRNGRNELFCAPTDASRAPVELGAQLAPHADGGDVASSFAIDPGSRWVVYRADRDLDERFRLFGAALDGSSGARELGAPLPPPGHVGWFAITPDGTRVAYQAYRGDDAPELASDLCVVSLGPEPVTSQLALATSARALRIAPDGRRLVYRDRHGRLGSLALDSGAAAVVLDPDGVDAFEISADSARVLYLRGGSREEAGLFSVAIDAASVPVRLVAPPVLGPSGGASGSTYASSAGSAGYRDFSYGTTGSSTPTGEKPECKLWWNDGSWWGDLYNDAAQAHHIYRLDLASQTWIDTGTTLDERSSSKSDVLWDGTSGKLYVASHSFTTNAQPTPSSWGRLFRYSYSAGSKTYALDPGFPVDITRGNAEALTIAKDSLGRLWASWVESSRVMINHSRSSDLDWDVPAVLPVSASATSLTSDDISAVLAFGGNRVGVMWSNQLTFETYFAVRRDTDAVTQWFPEEVVIPDANCSGQCSDDLFSLKSDASGRVLAVLKTSQIADDAPLNLVAVRGASGGWSTAVFGLVDDHHTRPILLLDEQGGRVHVFATSPENGGAIYTKSAPLDAPQFEPGLGTPFIRSPMDLTINNATSTKQNLDGQSDLVVLASDQNTRFYLHNTLELGPGGNPPMIGSFSPASGPIGTQVTIDASNYTRTNSVRFTGTQASFTVPSGSQIRTSVPGGATTGRIGVTTSNGSATSGSDFVVTTPPAPPSIGSFTPTSGPVGTQVTLDGTNFNGATSVRFNGTQASFTVLSGTQIRTTVPAGATTGRIGVTTPGGSATSGSDFTVTTPPAPPSIGSFTPTSGPVGTQVTINGGNLSGATSVRFNGTQASFTVLSANQIRATVPGGATTGRIGVTTPAGSAASGSDFVVTQPPSIGSFTPTSGPVGTQVTISGNHFAGTTSVRFNGTQASFSVLSATEIRATVPGGATTGRIRVTTPNGSALSGTDFVVTRPPSIGFFTPASGPVGTQVTISGSGFSGTTSVRFNGTQASFSVLSGTQIRTTVPGGATTGRIRVTTPNGSATSSDDFIVTQPPAPPSIGSFSPASGPAGTQVIINGSGFAGTTGVRFNGTQAIFSVLSGTQIRATVPAGATTGKIGVSTPNGTATSSASFTVTHPPVIHSFTPAVGFVATPVTITGSHFSGATSVKFNGRAAVVFTVIGDNSILALVPLGATSGKISVTTDTGTGVSSTNFTVLP